MVQEQDEQEGCKIQAAGDELEAGWCARVEEKRKEIQSKSKAAERESAVA